MKKVSLLLSVTLVFFLFFGAVPPAHAQGIISGDNVPAGTTIDDDVILFGDTVTIDGNVNGNVYALGGTVTVNGKIDGSLYGISQQVLINGEVTDGVYGLGLELTFGPAGKVGRNATFAGLSVSMPAGSSIGRDLTGIFALGAQFAGSVGRDTTAVIGPLELVRMIIGLFNIQAPSFFLPQAAHPVAMKLAAPVAFHPQQGIIDSFFWQHWLISTAQEYIGLLLVGLLAIWLLPGHLRRWGDKIRHAPFTSLGMGLTAILVGYIGMLLLWVLLMAVALGVGKIGFAGLGTAVGLLASFGIGTAGAIFFVVIMYLSKVVFAFQAGLMILKKYDRASFWFRLGVLALGLLIYVILAAIPFIGWAIAVVVMLLGTGAIFLIFNEDRRFEKQSTAVATPAEPVVVAPQAAVEAAPSAVVAEPNQPVELPPAPVEPVAPLEEPQPPVEAPEVEKPPKPKGTRKSSNPDAD